jgi:hypothetical protein
MRYAVLVLAVLGAVGSGYLGARWLHDYFTLKDKMEANMKLVDMYRALAASGGPNLSAQAGGNDQVEAAYQQFQRAGKTAPFLLAGVVLALAGGILALARQPKSAAALLLLAAAGPAVLVPKSLIFTCCLLIAGVLCLFVRPAADVPADLAWADG